MKSPEKSTGSILKQERLIENRRLANPVRSYLWKLLLPELPNTHFGINYLLSSRIDSVTVPFMSFATEKAPDKNSYWYFAEHNDTGTITIEIFEDEDGQTLKYFTDWMGLIVNEDGTYNPPVLFKKNLKFYRMNVKKNDIMVSTYHNYFVSSISELSNSYDDNAYVKYSVILTGDSVTHEVLDDIEIDKSQIKALDIEKSFKQNLIYDLEQKVKELVKSR